jgi:hypothetical protein
MQNNHTIQISSNLLGPVPSSHSTLKAYDRVAFNVMYHMHKFKTDKQRRNNDNQLKYILPNLLLPLPQATH